MSASPNTWVQVGGPLAFLRGLAGDRVVGREPVPLLPVRLGEGEALPLLGEHVDHARPVHGRARSARVSQQLLEVVAVDRAEVAEAQLLEEHPVGEEVLDALLDVLGEVHHPVAEDVAEREGQLLDLLAQPVGARVGDDAAERLADGADVGRDATSRCR